VTNSNTVVVKAGRPRNTHFQVVIFEAVMDSVRDGATLSSLSLAGIAQETGVSRNSFYRRWKSKEQLYSDVLTAMARPEPDLTDQSARENLIEIVKMTRDGRGGQRERRMAQAIVAEAENYSDLYDQYVAEIVAPLRRSIKLAIRRGKETGEIRNDVDEELLCDVLVLLASSGTSSITLEPGDFASSSRRTIDLVFDGVAPT